MSKKARVVEVLSTASEWFYKGFEMKWHDSMAGGYGQNDSGYIRAAYLLLEAAGYSRKTGDKMYQSASEKFKAWEAGWRKKQNFDIIDLSKVVE